MLYQFILKKIRSFNVLYIVSINCQLVFCNTMTPFNVHEKPIHLNVKGMGKIYGQYFDPSPLIPFGSNLEILSVFGYGVRFFRKETMNLLQDTNDSQYNSFLNSINYVNMLGLLCFYKMTKWYNMLMINMLPIKATNASNIDNISTTLSFSATIEIGRKIMGLMIGCSIDLDLYNDDHDSSFFNIAINKMYHDKIFFVRIFNGIMLGVILIPERKPAHTVRVRK